MAKDYQKEYMERRARSFLCILSMVFIVILSFTMHGCHPFEKINDFFRVKDDHAVEQMIEGFIEKETGVTIDLTPRSPNEN